MQKNNFVDSILNSAFSGLTVSNDSNAEQVAALLDKFGLRWSVSKQPLLLPDNTRTGFYGIVREDNNHCFSTCKESYQPFQNSELAELLIRIADKTGYEIHSGGSFNGGGKVYIQLNTGHEIKNIGKDKTSVKGFATGINSHDGSTSLKWGATNITISCKNTFAVALKKLQHTARHTENMRNKVEQSIREITGIAEIEKTIFDQFIKLSEIPVKKENIAKVVKGVTDVDILLSKSDMEQKYSTYAVNRTEELLQSISREMSAKGETLWGLFSGVTHYTSHVLPVPKRDNGRLESKYTGTGLDIDNSTYSEVLKIGGLN